MTNCTYLKRCEKGTNASHESEGAERHGPEALQVGVGPDLEGLVDVRDDAALGRGHARWDRLCSDVLRCRDRLFYLC